ncbi:MAG TPA: glycosyltransferase family 39 protein [Pyrinomonadaceae bacterium]
MDESLDRAAADAGLNVFGPGRARARALAWARGRAAVLACAALLALMSAQMLSVVWRKSVTVDEIVMIPAAYYHLAAGNCQLVHEHPPLSKILAGVPILFIQPEETDPRKFGHEPDTPEGKWTYSERFWEDNPSLFESISFWARVPMIALAALTGVLLFAFARELFGAKAAVLAVALYSLEPTVLAHGRVVQTDIPASFGYLLTCYALLKYLRGPTARRALLLGAAGGVACLTKFSMLMVGPLLGVVFVVLWWRAPRAGRTRRGAAAHAGAVALAALLVINAAYFFDHRPLGAEGVRWLRDGAGAGTAGAVVRGVEAASYVLPTDFVLGVIWQLRHNRAGHNASLLGMYSPRGWWYYFPVAFSLKTTLPFLLLSLASLAWGARRLWRGRDARFLFLLVPFAVYAAASMAGALNLGVRYFLPAYMFLFVLCGALLERLWEVGGRRRAGALLAAALLAWVCVEAARAYPDHMAYMNQLASRAPHWWYLSDSNVEWGDDTRALSEYLKSKGEKQVRALFLGGFLTLHHYGVDYLDALAVPKGPRYTAVGASFLNGSTVPGYEVGGRPATEEERVNTFDEYRRRTPEKIFGGSIYLFREDDR